MHGSALVLRNKSSSNFAGGSSSTFAAAPTAMFTEHCQLMPFSQSYDHTMEILDITTTISRN